MDRVVAGVDLAAIAELVLVAVGEAGIAGAIAHGAAAGGIGDVVRRAGLGAGAGSTILDGNGLDRVLYVAADITVTVPYEIKAIRPPATDEDIARLLAVWGDALPVSYLDFLRESDGAAGCVNDYDGDYLTLWGSGELVERNASLPTGRTSPELLAIGTDGRGGWVGLERVKSQGAERWPVVRWDSGGSGPATMTAPRQ